MTRPARSTPYHHGNLREALLESAIRLIAEAGPAAFTLREVARRAGVSHNAPYRHFHDKGDLLAAVAAEGYNELTAAMTAAGAAATSPRERLRHAGLAYVAFALRRPEHFTVMFEAAPAKHQRPEAEEARKLAFATLLAFVEQCQQKNQLPPGDPLPFALLAWTWVHGIAKLAITGRLPFRSRAKVLRFAEFVIDQSLPQSC
jgi:AcrR family transcriptional regulator